MRARLVSMDGSEAIDVNKDMLLIGRKEDCDVHLDHKSVSKMHCVIARSDGLLLLRDLGSTNGTRVNGQRVRRAALLPNDQVNIASLRYKVEISPDEPLPVQNDLTEAIDIRELEAAVPGLEEKEPDEGSSEVEVPRVQVNVLPDEYPEGTDGG